MFLEFYDAQSNSIVDNNTNNNDNNEIEEGDQVSFEIINIR